jgi:uncharacterized membrane protein
MLLLLQTLALGGGGWLVYRIARTRTETCFFPMLITISYFLNPLLERGWINDFHIDAIEVPLYLGAYACLLHARRHAALAGYWVLIALLLGCKEDVGLNMAAFGFVIAITRRRWLLGFGTAAVGLAWSVIAITQLLPHFASLGGEQVVVNRQMENYAHLGDTPVDIALAPILHPLRVAKAVLMPERLTSVLKVLLPVGLLTLASPVWLLVLGPPYLTTILSGWVGQYELHTHYGLVFLAPAYIGAIEGWRRLENRYAARPARLDIIALGAACLMLLSTQEFRKFSLSWPLEWRREYRTRVDREEVLEVGKLIPDDGVLSVDEGLGPHFSRRRYVYKFPVRPERVRFVLLNLDKANPIGPGQGDEFREIVTRWIEEDGFGIRKLRGETLLLEKGHTGGNQQHLLEKVRGKIRF